jgi:hypothetical protein
MLVLLMKAIYEVFHGDGLRWRGKRAMFHDDRLRHSAVVKANIHTETQTA